MHLNTDVDDVRSGGGTVPIGVEASAPLNDHYARTPHHGLDDGLSKGYEPIAIIGMGCRLPGEISSDSALWDFLREGRSGQCEIPKSRFNIDAFHHSKPGRSGSLPMRGGYFLSEDVRLFENSFFGINNLEATYMDPQQRKLLEVCFEGLESAGVKLEDVAGANIGCYVGSFTIDFQTMQSKDIEDVHRYSATGAGTTILSNRISHVFDLRGPSVTLDTACSSSLYCLHFACRALAQGDCDAAIVAAANLIQTPEQHMSTASAGVLSNTSTCHTFAADADGYGRADGISALYMKRLSDAIRDNDPIRSIVRGTAINSNGRTPGITLPSSIGQETVMAKAYYEAGLSCDTTDYVECHGTGTPVGDLIEVEAVASFFKKASIGHSRIRPLLIGSVKSNMGHSEAASGITSVIKTTLALENREIPATIGIDQLNPKIPWDKHNVQVVCSLVPWPQTNQKSHTPRASINSFGYGGSNAHCILERAEIYKMLSKRHQMQHERAYLVPVSAASLKSLKRRIQDLASMDLSRINVSDLAYTFGERRSQFQRRGFLIAKQETVWKDIDESQFQTTVRDARDVDLPYAFVFTGQGAQWPQMGKELFENYPVFRNSIVRLENYLSRLPLPPSWSLSSSICALTDSSDIHLPSVSQPACTAVQIALVDLLRDWQIIPSSVIGHSSGEIAAAYAAGHMSSFYAIAIAYTRGQIVSSAPSDGAMAAVGIGSDEAENFIQTQHVAQQVCVACINSPENVTLSGDASAIDLLCSLIQSRGKFTRRLKTGGRAYHSHHMKPLGEGYESMLSAIKQIEISLGKHYVCMNPEQIMENTTMISSCLARCVTSVETSNPVYWRHNLESPVLFNAAGGILLDSERYQLIEIGPHPTLELPIKQIQSGLAADQGDTPYFSALYRDKDSERSALNLVGSLWALGYPVAFNKVNKMNRLCLEAWQGEDTKPRVLQNLPTYKWDYSEPLWREPRASVEFRLRKFPRDELLGSLIPGASGFTSTWRNLLGVADVPWLQDHKLANIVIFPGAGYIAMASKAVQQLVTTETEDLALEIHHMKIMRSLTLSPGERVELFTELTPRRISNALDSSSWWQFTIMTFHQGRSIKHASGSVGFTPKSNARRLATPCLAHDTAPQAIRNWYIQFLKVGLNFGPTFQSLSEVSNPRMRNAMTTTAKMVELPVILDEHSNLYKHDVHPITVDALLQAGIIATTKGVLERLRAMIPVTIECLRIYPHFQHEKIPYYSIHTSANMVGPGAAIIQSELRGLDKEPLIQLSDVKAAPFHGSTAEESTRHPMLRVVWQPDLSKILPEHEVPLAACISQLLTQPQAVATTPCDNLAKMLRLLSYGHSNSKVLEIGYYQKTLTESLMSVLDCNTSFQRFSTYTRGRIDGGRLVCRQVNELQLSEQENEDTFEDVADQKFDIIVCPYSFATNAVFATEPRLIIGRLALGGKLLLAQNVETGGLIEHGLRFLSMDCSGRDIPITLAWRALDAQEPRNSVPANSNDISGVFIIARNLDHPLNERLKGRLQGLFGCKLATMEFDDLATRDIPAKSTVIVTAELEDPLLVNLSPERLGYVQKVTNNASTLLWITGGNLMASQKPEFSAVLGLARTVMAEQPALRFFVVDLDSTNEQLDLTVLNLISVLNASSAKNTDYEYLQKDGILHISRFIPDKAANDTFRSKKAADATMTRFSDAQCYELSIKEPGQFGTLQFIQLPSRLDIPSTHVEVTVKSVGLNAKDIFSLAGKIETRENTCSCEFAGVVTRIGSAVSSLSVGDRVAVMVAGRFSTCECVPEWACCKMQDNETFTEMSTVPVAFMTAIHALHNVASLKDGESVLIHSAAGGVGIAATQLAKDIGAEIFATVGTEEKKTFMVDQFGLNPAHIFYSRDLSFLPRVMEITNNRGVDVVLNSLTGEQLHCGLEACANFGRFVEIGKRDIVDAGNLNMGAFARCLTFSAFDLHELYYSSSRQNQEKLSRLLFDGIELFRRMRVPPPTVFDVSEISSAFRQFSNANRVGKVAVSYENSESLVPVVPQSFTAKFDPNKSYFLVGCLGGLGRSITRYMLSNGARHFTFLGRSGTDNHAAACLVQDLQRSGANVDVVRGDVQDFAAVRTVIDTMKLPLGGVVQAAMGLSESLFTTMTHRQWHTSLGPKIKGTWNIHNAIAGKDAQLDFFLLTSSLSGSTGSATESNYCAANCFLDYFASYRRSQGLPATSIGLGQISEVGYLHEHPEIEQMLARRGMAAITEHDVLQIIDIALSEPRNTKSFGGGAANAHILSGLEPSNMQSIWVQGYEPSHENMRIDSRLSILALAIPKFQHAKGSAPVKDGLPPAITAALAAKDCSLLEETLFEALATKLAHLILVPLEKITQGMHLHEVGMDSMLATEYRTFVFRTFNVDIPFLTLMGSKTDMLDITRLVCDGLLSPNVTVA